MTNAVNLASAADSGFLRNRIINGDMRIDQRNNGSSVSIASAGGVYYLVDRFFVYNGNTATLTAQRSTTAPSGFTNSLLFTVTGTSTGSSQTAIYHRIEGLNTADLGFGTSSASTVTLSFWVRSSVTGTYNCALRNGSQNRSYVATYTINSANTWEQKTVTIVGDTGGTWATDNTNGIEIVFSLGTGATQTAGIWAAPGYVASSGATNLTATNGATFYITGVQLELGSVATPFERRLYGQELALCQRYYEAIYYASTGYGNNSNAVVFGVPLKVTKRASPTVTIGTDPNGEIINFPTPSASVQDSNSVWIATAGTPTTGMSRFGSNLAISAEL
jgi:hypothetical protein